MIALTHVCRGWRKIFTSRSALWTNIDCENADKTLIYLNRSRASPISVRLERDESLSPDDPFIQAIPRIITRLKSMSIHATPGNLQEVIAQLSHSAPLLESLTIEAKCESPPQHCPMIMPTLFDGDLSSLRELHLQCILTTLPWRNMVNLTSFTLAYVSSDQSPVRCLLDFFQSAPRLCQIKLQFAASTFGAQRGRLVSLECLKRMDIIGSSPSLLLGHLLVPADAKLVIHMDSRRSLHLPGSLDFLAEFSRFGIRLYVRDLYPSMQFVAPNCKISIVPATPRASTTCRVLESLAQFDPSKIERLGLADGDLTSQHGRDFGRALPKITNLRSITISRCRNLSGFIPFLGHDVCPKLEEFVLGPSVNGEKLNIRSLIGLVARRASRKEKFKSVRIVTSGVALASGNIGGSDEED